MDIDMLKRLAEISAGTYSEKGSDDSRNLENDILDEDLKIGKRRVEAAIINRNRVKRIKEKTGISAITQYQTICVAYLLGLEGRPDIEGPTGIGKVQFRKDIERLIPKEGVFRKGIYLTDAVEHAMEQLNKEERLDYSPKRFADAYHLITGQDRG